MSKLFRKLLISIGVLLRRFFNIGIPLKFVVIFCALITVISITVTKNQTVNSVGGKDEYSEAMSYIELKNVIENNYIDTVDRTVLADASAASLVNSLGDKWSYYMSADEYNSYLLSASTDYTGIGIALTKDSSGGFYIQSVNQGSVSASAGLNPGMVIISIDGQDVTSMDTDEIRTLIRSNLNKKFEITVQGNSTPFEIDCESTYSSRIVYRKEKTDAGYVQIPDFEAGSGSDAVAAIESLLQEGIDSLVIDVRNNPGGLSSEIQILLDYLLPEGDLYYSVDKAGNEETAKSDSLCLQLPLVVLINKGTYAEAEVFAASIQDYSWGTLMGEATTGMTRSQQTIQLSDGSAVRLSTRAYLTPNHVDICSAGGVVPEVIIYNSDESYTGTTSGTTGGEEGTASTSNDEQLMEALTYLSKNV